MREGFRRRTARHCRTDRFRRAVLTVRPSTPRLDPMTERPVDNAPYLSLTHGGLTIEGYSRAAVQSYWRVPELKLGFDLGGQPWDFMGTPTWFVSHTHLDHIAALPVYVARRRMMKMDPPTIYVPAESVEDVKKLMLVMQRLDRGRQHCELIGVEPGQEIELSPRARRDGVATRSTRSRAAGSSSGSGGTSSRRSTGLARREDPRPAALRHGGDARGAHCRWWRTPATPPRRAWTPARRRSRRRC